MTLSVTRQTPGEPPRARRAITDNGFCVIYALDRKHWGEERNDITRKNVIDFLAEPV